MSEQNSAKNSTIRRMAQVMAEALFEHMEQNPHSVRAIWPDCTTCLNWDSNYELCKLNGCRPPAHIIVNGCECYDTIPY